ncbi:hypothetical protein DQJ50_25370, partial [Salmonella enterica subsp. enterica]|nr:hypothetical protein [Salmonella enterica subsp. enterica serovar Newport]
AGGYCQALVNGIKNDCATQPQTKLAGHIIRVANLPVEKKSGLISKLRELPSDAIKHLTLQLLTPAVLHPQAVIQSIEKFLQSM